MAFAVYSVLLLYCGEGTSSITGTSSLLGREDPTLHPEQQQLDSPLVIAHSAVLLQLWTQLLGPY